MTQTLPPADARRDKITQAAADVFIRYGFARTTMGDIAAAAGIARPTLYLSFPQKQDIFGAVIELLASRKLAEIRAELAGLSGLGAKLRHACLSWGLAGFDLVRANPDAKDMFDLNFAPVRQGHAGFIRLLADMLQDAGRDNAEVTARMMGAALKGFKLVADDREQVQEMIHSLCAAVAETGS
ncbi:MAG: TetR/AcrR family transcriptional regulator [Paracoccus sp. (in: a-proteobacteria)]|uniref:TetR/AcrR family transcriptional regulator n=1 Tax=Paracoccus sp. TaxID=267 RepID=UPI0026E07F1C|nr:TetR/AcrR family transcriptional regulator [Paracoccus sp. (in: a-proteobacteria)]MDO5614465.1 TetR/AcrR family transcriptional regulator [Paracoccus sp. (in: a-proteobacteria)]